MSEDKECFFIAPIGDEESEIRQRTNKLMEYIVDEAVSDYGYSVTRADQMDEPGSITSQIIQKTVDSELVVADLTGHNPNVFYELAVRHATGEPCIQLIQSTDSIPFDISDLRTIPYGLDVAEAEKAREKIRSILDTLEDEDLEFDNPISRSAEMQSLRESTDPTHQNLAEILDTLSRLDRKVENLDMNPRYPQQSTLKEAFGKNNIELIDKENDSQALFKMNDELFTVTEDINSERLRELAHSENVSFARLLNILEEGGIKVTDS